MGYENIFNEAYQNALKAKNLYLANAIEQEELTLLKRIGLSGWDEAERSRTYEQEVIPYWERFGYVPKQFWFELNGSRDHRMDPRFIPADLYYTGIMPYLTNGQQHYGLMNKGYLDYLFADVKRPETVILKIEGVYTDEKRNIIREEEAIGLCRERGGVLFLKLSAGSKSGKGIYIIEPAVCTDDEIRNIFKKAGSSFIVQEKIRQHQLVPRLNPSSVSTIRVVSLLMEDEVYIASAVLRVSSPEMPYVTVHDGGLYIEILEDGRLQTKVYDNNGGWPDRAKDSISDHVRIPSMERIYEDVRRIHPRVGHFKCVGWDFAVDECADPVMLEFNVFPGIDCSQVTCCKPIFGDKTDWILEDYFLHRTWAQNHRQDILIY